MSKVIRVALSGYNALTDTDPDHFSLYTDEDWVLIKELTRGSVVISQSSNTVIDHDLGYIPFFIVMVYDQNLDDKWKNVAFFQSAFEVPPYLAWIDSTRLQIYNFYPPETTFKYYIFYDQQA